MQFTVSGLGPSRNERFGRLITSAAHKHFKIEKPPLRSQGPAAFLVAGRLRVVFDEVIVQFKPGVTTARCLAILAETGFSAGARNESVKNQWIARHAEAGVAGKSLLAAADRFKSYKEVLFAWPNSVAQYRRASTTATAPPDWWLARIGVVANGTRLLDEGDSDVLIAVLDDGVDIEHPNLASRVAAGLGRDYAIPLNEPGHDNPRPKVKVDSKKESDYHGTACAGLVCSDGTAQSYRGVAPGCRLVAVRVIDGPALINEHSLAQAIRYATGVADVISCSWNGPQHADVVQALNDTIEGRDDKGTAVFCAVGNDGGYVAFPAWHGRVIAVGSCDHEDAETDYSNFGDAVSVVAPSSNGIKIFTTDVSQAYWGFNPGSAGDPDGLFYKGFGGTSASTAIAAGVGALCFSANPDLTVDELRTVLQGTAAKIGGLDSYDEQTNHSQQFGYGCIDAAAAVAVAKCMLDM